MYRRKSAVINVHFLNNKEQTRATLFMDDISSAHTFLATRVAASDAEC